MSRVLTSDSSAAARPRRLAAGLLLGPAAWSANGLLGWFISARACAAGGAAGDVLGPGAARIAIGAVGLIALALALAGARIASRSWRGLSADRRLAAVEALDSREFLAVAGLLVSGACAAGIVLFALPALLVDVCVSAR